MESHQPQKHEVNEGRPEAQTPRQRRFRVIKLEERIAPKRGGNGTNNCETGGNVTHHRTCACYTVYCGW